MNRRKIEIATGLFVLLGIAAIAYLAFTIGDVRLFTNGSYPLKARFTNITGLNVGSDVRISGVAVGKVTGIEMDPTTFYAEVEFEMPKRIKLDDDTIASIRTKGLIGDKFLSLLPGASGIPLEPGELIVDTESVVDIESLISRIAFGTMDDN